MSDPTRTERVERIEDFGPIQRAYAEAMHEDCPDPPPGHPVDNHSPWSGGDLDGVPTWQEFTDQLARHGLALAALSTTPAQSLPSVEALAEAMDESFWPEDLPFIDDRDGFWLPFAAKVRAAPEGAPVASDPTREALSKALNVIAIAQGRLDAIHAGRGAPVVWRNMADDLARAFNLVQKAAAALSTTPAPDLPDPDAPLHLRRAAAADLSRWTADRLTDLGFGFEIIAKLPFVLYRKLPSGGKERAIDHPLYPVLHDQPNPDRSTP